jgi:hypothetical protein
MPHLNWKAASLTQSVTDKSGAGSEATSGAPEDFMTLSLELTASLRDELLPRLREIFQLKAEAESLGSERPALNPELRVDLPRNWILFWKLRDGESRLLIAHPQSEEWVMTSALNAEHASRFLSALGALEPGNSLSLAALAPVARVSNAALRLTLTA